MGKCIKIEFPTKEICIANLRHRIEIITHTILPPIQTDVEYTIDKENILFRWAAIKTLPNRAVFDDANQEQIVSHEMYVRYSPVVTSEHWVRFKGDFYNIIATENIDERNEYLLLKCNLRGKEPL